ncbi:restriction endonuclease subunit S [Acinetobacter baumannii]|nr:MULTISPECIES: restriction endonuclease subunit S [Acinetobacter]MDV5211901.1 restriction endonuclease subunit S [Acinetobacter baumannii]MDV5263208.1 restriction endonuclease subunit S [Acinetobacter baumannii]MDV5275434.1 restriction endonuclease subunit S [Acinetobacter baumannii]MEB6566148.1 restriction endonuclease subunit S [Acinetobacter towneri]HDZ1842885.1 restriction endonuclease subunit S [Acinetobacter baumannii]
MTAPKLRFKEFDKDWNTVNLKNCIESIDSGWSPQCESYPANSSQWGVLKTTSVDWSGFQENANKKLPDHLEPRPEIEVKPYDILVTRAGPTERVGVVSVVPNNVRKKLLISDKLIRIKSDKDNDPNFLGISLSSSKCQNQLQSKTSGLAKSQTNISQKILLDVTLQTPFKAEQTKIATFLSAVDEKISQLSQKLHLLGQYKQGMMQKLFSQQIRFKADDDREFMEWEEKELKNVVEINPKAKKLPENFIYIDLESVEKGRLLLQKNIALQDAPSRAQRLLAKGDVLFQMVRPYQQNNYYFNLSGEYVASTGYAQIRTKLDSKFIYYALHEKTFLDEVMNRCTGTSYPAINSSDLSSIEILIPCLEEQTKIANFLSAIDQKIDVVSEQLEQAKLWKKGLLQQMFV